MFLTNHDENSWAGTIDSLMGDAQQVFATLIFTAQGMPLIYSGQEACLNKKLKFFVKDVIKWDTCQMTEFYSSLIRLKKGNYALWNGDFGGKMIRIKTGKNKKIFAFYREKDDNRVVVILNLSKKTLTFRSQQDDITGEYIEYFTAEKTELNNKLKIKLNPWSYMVLIR
jgi:glycosidase